MEAAAAEPAVPSLNPFRTIFPEDIEREIWETAARLHTNEAPSYRLVSKYVKLWIDPIIYSTIIWHIEQQSPKCNLLEILTTQSHHIQHLLFRTGKGHTNLSILQLLPLCPNIIDLAIWADTVIGVIKYCQHLRPKRLSISFETLFSEPSGFNQPTHPIFTDLTHLELVATCYKWSDWKELSKLPRLTHLSLTYDSTREVVDGVLDTRDGCKLLKILVLVDGHATPKVWETETHYEHSDPRVVALAVEYISDWEEYAWGRRNSWLVAEGIVAERLRKRSKSVPYHNLAG
ncbi:hypothetical protein BDN72DRAFT_843666 [Pluteus cervinus]|uniref:Uncharacterized protein n=1 Tax=Pluteus cervinus TaxID=181527 RepID=A0ACD3ANR4_9AGAR|nr:hypothetical protein BDN72DRAFT_843666 [Pluteus cervinus]